MSCESISLSSNSCQAWVLRPKPKSVIFEATMSRFKTAETYYFQETFGNIPNCKIMNQQFLAIFNHFSVLARIPLLKMPPVALKLAVRRVACNPSSKRTAVMYQVCIINFHHP